MIFLFVPYEILSHLAQNKVLVYPTETLWPELNDSHFY
jgi:hypothetical protein